VSRIQSGKEKEREREREREREGDRGRIKACRTKSIVPFCRCVIDAERAEMEERSRTRSHEQERVRDGREKVAHGGVPLTEAGNFSGALIVNGTGI